jgi:putative FmdB family regulatory protein
LPTYEYACKACGHRLDAVQSFTDDPLTECPECGGDLRKVYGAVGIAFKGSGFYKTDSRASTAKSNGEAKPSGDAAAASSDTKSDSTSTAKTDSPKPSSDNGSTSTPKKESKPAATTAS